MRDISKVSSGWANSAFFIITIIYVVIKYFVTKQKGQDLSSEGQKSNIDKYLLLGYVVIVIIMEFFFNMQLLNSMCGSVQPSGAFWVTIVPWLVIFTILSALISFLPGWLSPFSNTFGYFIAKMSGIITLLKKVIKEQSNVQETGTSNDTIDIIKNIYSDPSKFINTLPSDVDSFNNAWSGLINDKIITNNDNNIKVEIYNKIHLKDIVAECIWLLLSGWLASSICVNNIVNKKCSNTLDEISEQTKDFKSKTEIEKNNNKLKNPAKIYTIK
jgi:hypothetical protein